MPPEPISWTTAEKVAAKVARNDPYASSYLRRAVDDDLVRLTIEAQQFIGEHTGLIVDTPTKALLVDRDVWAATNISSFRRLLEPLTAKLGANLPPGRGAQIGRSVTGAQVGVILGWMSSRVLGQYVPLLHTEEPARQDVLLYVVPNLLAMEKRFGFPPEEFRLWIALHECTHRAQFVGVPWMAPHLRSLIDTLLTDMDTDGQSLKAAVEAAVTDLKNRKLGKVPADDASTPGSGLTMFATPAQRESIERIQGLMALLEGHAEVVMSRAAEERVPSAPRFQRVIDARRAQGSPVAKFFQRVLGLDKKMKQYAEGARFVRAVEAAGGDELFAQVWRSPEDLPRYEEIVEPRLWIERHAQLTA